MLIRRRGRKFHNSHDKQEVLSEIKDAICKLVVSIRSL